MIRARLKLPLLFAAALAASVAIIAAAVTFSRTESMYSGVGNQALADADLALRIVRHGATAREMAATRDSAGVGVLPARTVELLDIVPDYLVVVSNDGNIRFMSESVRNLSDSDWTSVQRGISDIPDDGPAGVINLSQTRVLFVAHAVRDSASGIRRVVAGVRVRATETWSPELLTTLLVVAPVIIAIATWAAWLLLGGPFRRVERIRREVADITDGRSLHRRLSPDEAGPELAHLIETLNSMIARLETSFTALRRFTADASHELKTPLAVLRADVERAMSVTTRKDDRLVALEEALHETTRMADLVESLLTLARADEGRFDLHRERVDLTAVTHEVYETALILGEDANVNVTMPFTADVTVMGDRTRLRQLFLNLVTNAIKYTPAGGRVDIGLGRHPETATFAVRDTGVGIAAADIPHVFERFWRADRARSRTAERGGWGLGLAISQWIAQAHGGTLTVQSRLGKGSLFTLTLPLEDSLKSADAEQEGSDAS